MVRAVFVFIVAIFTGASTNALTLRNHTASEVADGAQLGAPGKKDTIPEACAYCHETWPPQGEDGPKCMAFKDASGGYKVMSSARKSTQDYCINGRGGCFCDPATNDCK